VLRVVGKGTRVVLVPLLPRMHPHMLRHTFVTTMLDAGVDLRDVQIAARHADPRTTMRYDRARKNLDRHPNYILAAYVLRHLNVQPVLPMSERVRQSTLWKGSSSFARWPQPPHWLEDGTCWSTV